ncbi:MAG: ABC transporter substrate-binding protein [Alphaproteobacteria bacterium]|nr:ABC transporter substrate-binding protein [Alphaproteobacteria bacterium]
MLRRPLILMCLAFGLGLIAPAPARAQQGATQAIERLNAALLDVMRNASIGYRGRAQRLQPVLTSTYDLAQMGQVAVGRTWSTTAPEQQRQLVDLFTQFTVANYASRFNGYSGERFEVLGEQEAANGMVMVRTQIVRSNDRPVPINYLMRRQGNAWRVVDVFLDSTISEVARRRSEFGSVIARGGMESLLQTLRDRVAQIERDTPR